MVEKFSQNAIDISLKELNKSSDRVWIIKEDKLHREFKFPDFISAFGFMTKVAISLTTHEAGGISNRDFELADEISRLVL